MTNHEILLNCRAGVIALRQLNHLLENTQPFVQPACTETQHFCGTTHGTNVPMAAAMQLYDGLKTQEEKLTAEVTHLTKAAWRIIERAGTPQHMVILNHYYMMGMTDQEIAVQQGITREHACRKRREALKFLQ